MTILAATDFSENAESAVRTAAAEARRRETTLTLLHSIETIDERWEYVDATPEDSKDIETAARERLQREFDDLVPTDEQPEVAGWEIRQGHAAEWITQVADQEDVELVVQGATGGGALARLVLGSTAEEVVRTCSAPVLTVPHDARLETTRRVLAPIDLSDCSRTSLAVAAQWARRHGSDLSIVHTTSLPTGALTLMEWEPSESDREEHLRLRSDQLDEFLEEVDLEGLDYDVSLEFGAPAREIVKSADDQSVDLIVMGTHGRRGFERFLLGSTAAKVLRQMPCPVLTVRHTD